MKNLRLHNIPEYLKNGIIDINITVLKFASLFQYFAPIVLGIISHRTKIKMVIIPETKPIKESSVISLPKKV